MSSLNANPRSIGYWLIRMFCAGGAAAINQWFRPSVSTKIRRLIYVPEGQRTLAGGGAQRNHGKRHNRGLRALEGRRTKVGSAANLGPASLPGREIVFGQFRWLRCAPPPANVRCASGAKNCVGALGWRHRLISVAHRALKNPPAGLLARARIGLFTVLLLVVFSASCRQDMQDQPKYKPLAPSSFFSDGKSARQLVEGTAPYSPEGKAAPPITDQSKMTTLPFNLTPQVMDRGQGRFNIYCSPCHGRLGYGNGMVVQRGFRAPPSFHIDRLRQAPVGHFYGVMADGFGAMPSYADKVAPDDRWAVAAYIRALQLSQHATINDAPPEERAKLQSGGQKQ